MKKQGVRYWHEPVGAMVAKILPVRHNSSDNVGRINDLREHWSAVASLQTKEPSYTRKPP
jgi:hypothetical protein